MENNSAMQKKLVIFDCDGVLVDSEVLASIAVSNYLHSLNITLSPSECRTRFRGKSTLDMVLLIEKEFEVKLPKDFSMCIENAIDLKLTNNITKIPYADKTLQYLKDNDVDYCLASSGVPSKISRNLDRTNLARFFATNITSAVEVKYGKPFPDIFHLAAQKMGYTCDEAIIVEDSESGVVAGIASGAKVYALTRESEMAISQDLLKDVNVTQINCLSEIMELSF